MNRQGDALTVDLPVQPWSQDREQILARYLELLAMADSPLLRAGPQVTDQMAAQLYGVIDAVHATISKDDVPDATTSGARLSAAIGRNRATARVHPSQSLQAASLIFEAALPTLARRLAAVGESSPELTAGLLLNREILQRMAAAARAYVDHLLDKAHGSNRDERRRLSRELHDVAAPAVAVGLQNLELFDVYAGTDPARAAEKIDAARQSLLDALTTIRNLSAQSRENVASSGLHDAVRRLLDTVPAEIRTDVTTHGDLAEVSLAYAEELFLVIREAVRNAVDHGHPQHIQIEITVEPGVLTASVRDDGKGFDLNKVLASRRHVGIDSMHERAELLGADLTVESAPKLGTTIAARVSLPGGSARPTDEPTR